MLKNYFKTAFRNLLKFKAFSLINIFGLAIGISIFLIITLFVKDELTYDSFHEKADQIYRIPMHVKFGETDINVANTPPILAESLKREFPEIIETTRLMQDLKFVYKGLEKFKEENFFFADSSIFDVFSINLIHGNPQTALANPAGVVLTEDIAQKYFGSESAMGQPIRTTDGMELTVTGIAERIPENSLFEFEFLASIYIQPESRSDAWLHNFAQTYFVLEENASWRELENKLPAFIENNVSSIMSIPYQAFLSAGNKYEYFLQPLLSIHLTPGVYNEFKNAGDATILYFLSAIALFILLIACINFINLSTARSTKRANEIGVRKVLGSSRPQLVNQFLAETILLTFVAVVLALVIVEIFSPIVGSVADKNLGIDYISNWYVIPLLILFTIIIGIVAGIYPSFFITSFQPVQALKGKIYKGKKGVGIRKGLVVFQFAVSIILIIATSVVLLQMNYIRNKDLGYDKEQIFVIQNADVLGEQRESFKNKLLTNSNILNAASSNSLQNHDLNLAIYQKDDGSDEQFTPVTMRIDDKFIETYKFQFVEGRSFTKLHASDSLSIILNQTAVKMLGYDSPLERLLILDTPDEGSFRLNIIGVVKDFHTQQLHEAIRPSVFILSNDNDLHFLSIKLSGVNLVESVEFIKEEWEKFVPDQPIDFVFFDESFDRMYEAEIRTSKLFSSFAGLAIIIACLGLFGLITFSAEQRTKEIGIRKV
ncbi:ABC transporter permease, partial [Bacteroidota bacterium]